MVILFLSAAVLAAAQPRGFHLSWGSAPGSVVITWSIVGDLTPPAQSKPRCYLDNGTAVSATSATYNDSCTGPSCTRWAGWVHTVQVDAGAKSAFGYRCGDDMHGFREGRGRGRRAPAKQEAWEFLAIADVGYDNNAQSVRDALLEPLHTAQFLLEVGDIAYANGNQTLWDVFFDVWEPVHGVVPTLFSPGNHDGAWVYGNNYEYPESQWVGGGESGRAYTTRLPGPGPAVQYHDATVGSMVSTSFWWSVGHGGVRIIATSAVHDFEEGSPQFSWFVQELQRANLPSNRAAEPWVVVTNHFPVYCTIDDCFCGNYTAAARRQLCEPGRNGTWLPGILEMNAVRMQETYEPLLLKYNVDIFLTGHEHAYERTLPVRNFVVNPRNNRPGAGAVFSDPADPLHVMAGTGGGSPDTQWRSQKDYPWTSVRSDAEIDDTSPFGYLRFFISGDRTNLTAQYVLAKSHRTHLVLDSFTILKTLG